MGDQGHKPMKNVEVAVQRVDLGMAGPERHIVLGRLHRDRAVATGLRGFERRQF